jgi:hypothetical protein
MLMAATAVSVGVSTAGASASTREPVTEIPSLRTAYTRGATLATSAKQVEEGDRLTLTATITSPAQAARVTLQKSYVSVYYGTTSWQPVKTVAVRGRRAVKFGVVALGPNADRYRVSVTYKTGKPAASRPTNVQVWRWIPRSKYAPYYATSGAGFGDLALNGHPYRGWGAATYSSARAWEAKFTPGRHCKTFRGVIGVADISADGSSGAINFTADDEIVYESPSLTPGMDVPVTIRLSTPYRFGIQAFNTSPEAVRSWPVIGDPALLCTGV